MALHLQTVPAGRGVSWFREGFDALSRRPLGFLGMFALFMLVVALVSVVPFVGTVATLMAPPLLSLGFMIATRSVMRDGPAHPSQFLEPLLGDARRRRDLLVLCALYAVGVVLMLSLIQLVDGGRLMRLQELAGSGSPSEADRREIDALLDEPATLFGMIAFGLATVVLAVPFWHAPALVWWGGQGVGQALFSSTLACWRSRGALVLYGASWAAVIGLVVLVTTVASAASSLAGMLVGYAGALGITCALYASLYPTFRDTFASDQMIDTPLA